MGCVVLILKVKVIGAVERKGLELACETGYMLEWWVYGGYMVGWWVYGGYVVGIWWVYVGMVYGGHMLEWVYMWWVYVGMLGI